jgi:hypothetical protein
MKLRKNLAISDTGFIFYPLTGDSYSVNNTGLQIIRMAMAGKSFDEIMKQVISEYRVDEKVLEKDLLDFFKVLDNYSLTE